MKLLCKPKSGTYPIHIERGLLDKLNKLMPTYTHTAIVTDSGIPQKWIDKVQQQIPNSTVIKFPQSEANKNFTTLEQILTQMKDHHLTRKDAVIALGGGVTGDMAGLAAALYMRGIDFYNIPTTVLAQVDSSVGGKTAIDLGTTKNLVGAFWQPKAVYIDPDVLETLPKRHIANGLVEALKMGLILDERLIQEFEKPEPDIDTIITRSIQLKRDIVQQDETEQGCRALLNFGHTIGHAIEGANGLDYLHGECVAAGMQYFIDNNTLKQRTQNILKKLNIPQVPLPDKTQLIHYIRNDKKADKDTIHTIHVQQAGKATIQDMTIQQLENLL